MESKDLYQHLLGLSTPWTVERVELDMAKQHVDVYVEHPKGTRFACPQCGHLLDTETALPEDPFLEDVVAA